MEKAAKKLVLSKETLRTLNEDELDEVTGGKSGICVDSVACQSGICNSGALCQSAVCHSAVCGSIVCGSGVLCG